MKLSERLASLDEAAQVKFLNGLVTDQKDSEYGQLMQMALDDLEKSTIALLKRSIEGDSKMWNAIGRLQAVEIIRALTQVPPVVNEEAPKETE